MLYSDEIACTVADLGYTVMLTEGADAALGMRSPNQLFAAGAAPSLRVLARNFRLSDDVGFRFSDQGWSEWPLTAARYAEWIAAQHGTTANVFLDFETLGEHHAAKTGIFDFVADLPRETLVRGVGFHLPSEAAELAPVGLITVPAPISWADRERDDSAWLGNRMQSAAAKRLYGLLPALRAGDDAELLETWRRLSTSDHLYYVSTKGLEDGGVHAYFSPFESPYDAFIALMNVLTDFERRVAAAVPVEIQSTAA
jgi:alpha-amylase